MIKTTLKFVLLFLFAIGAVQGQEKPTLAVRAGRLIDVRSGKVSNDAYIVIAKDRIVRIADSAPTGVRVIDLSKYTVVPGLIDSHKKQFGECGTCKYGWTMDSPLYATLARAIRPMDNWHSATALPMV